MIEDTISTLLLADPGVSALVGTRVFKVILPQAPILPAITIQRVSAQRSMDFRAPITLVGARESIDCWASTNAGVWDVAFAVRDALNGFHGSGIQGAFLVSDLEQYEPDVKLWRVISDFRVWYSETGAAA